MFDGRKNLNTREFAVIVFLVIFFHFQQVYAETPISSGAQPSADAGSSVAEGSAATGAAATCASLVLTGGIGGVDLLGTGVNPAVPINGCLAAVEASKVKAAAGKVVTKTMESITKIAENFVEKFLKMAWHIFRKMLLDYMVNQIIAWINGEGVPQFVTDFEGFAKGLADDALGETLNKIVGTNLCSNWGPLISISLARIPTFGSKSRCSFSQIGVSYENFMNDFNQGGWRGWIKLTEDANNPYTIYLNALDERTKLASAKQLAGSQKVQSGAGFLGMDVCVEMESCPAVGANIDCENCDLCESKNDTSEDCQATCATCSASYTGESQPSGCYIETGEWKKNDIPQGSNCTKWETKTPGKIAADTLSFSVSKDMQWLINNGELEAYVAAIVDALINRIIKEGITALTSDDVSGKSGGSSGSPIVSDYIDSIPPATLLSYDDAWHVRIDANEKAIIYYTIDGTEPYLYSLLYQNPISIVASTTLKWFGIDNLGNQENIHTIYLNPPFSGIGPTGPSTTAAAVDSNSVALISSSPATIYYTVDNSTPTVSSSRYIKKIAFGTTAGILKWFAIDDSGNQETIKDVTFMPPFPNLQFPTIVDLTAPAANIVAPALANVSQFFTLDSSLSLDSDSTQKIVMYEWDFDNDGTYDWWITDYNRDGIFEEKQCKPDSSGAVNSYCSTDSTIGAGFAEMQGLTGASVGKIEAKYNSDGVKTIKLRVTDDEGLSGKTSINVNVQ